MSAPAQPAADIAARMRRELDEAERKALDSLGRYKFQMFGYWAAIWVHLNRLGGFGLPNPFSTLVMDARDLLTNLDAEFKFTLRRELATAALEEERK
jgi:hypothetical protein